MKKILIISISALAALVALASCDKGESVDEFNDSNATVKALKVNATLSSASGEGMKTVFAADDFVRVRFSKSDGTKTGRTQILRNTSGEAASATFSANKIAIPKDAETMIVYLDNNATNGVNYGAAPTVDNLGTQKGTLADAVAHQVILGTTAASEAASGSASVNLACKTSIIKVVTQFPEGSEPSLEETSITLNSVKQYSKVFLPLDNPSSESEKGVITVKPASVDKDKRTATSYIAVWFVGGEYDKTSLIARIGSTTYGNPLEITNFPAGKTTNLSQEVTAKVFTFWVSDAVMTIPDVDGDVESSESWITKSGSVITVAENATGKSRTGSMVLNNGKSYTITQIGQNDFKGSYSFTSKIFCPNKEFIPAPGNKITFNVTFGEPLLGETLTDGNGNTYTNGIGIRGLYYDGFVADACIDINYDTKAIRLGVFLDARKAQKLAALTGDNQYAAILPELCGASTGGSNFGGPYTFVAPDLGEPDYEWLWFETEDNKTFTNSAAKVAQTISTKNSYAQKFICGMSVVLFKGEDATGANAASSYDTIYQFNTNQGNIGLVFSKN